jgi:drug/metabolite transporter (DMT)-like permease
MELWIPITVLAAAAQTLRFMLQKHLAGGQLSTFGATWARFLYAAPLVVVLLFVYVRLTGQDLPRPRPGFWGYAGLGGVCQILATLCVVALFGRRNFAVGITFKKTEVMLTALAGFLILGDRISFGGAIAIAVGFLGVLWLSATPENTGRGLARFVNGASALGVLSGVFFALSAIGYRGAVLAMEGGDLALRSGLSLAVVSTGQAVALGIWIGFRDPGEVGRVLASWRTSALIGVFSMIGSFCWFAAFSLQNAAYVFALGQVEVVFSILAATLFFRERVTAREGLGIALLTGSIILLVWLG